jgi:hypothetical protein
VLHKELSTVLEQHSLLNFNFSSVRAGVTIYVCVFPTIPFFLLTLDCRCCRKGERELLLLIFLHRLHSHCHNAYRKCDYRFGPYSFEQDLREQEHFSVPNQPEAVGKGLKPCFSQPIHIFIEQSWRTLQRSLEEKFPKYHGPCARMMRLQCPFSSVVTDTFERLHNSWWSCRPF